MKFREKLSKKRWACDRFQSFTHSRVVCCVRWDCLFLRTLIKIENRASERGKLIKKKIEVELVWKTWKVVNDAECFVNWISCALRLWYLSRKNLNNFSRRPQANLKVLPQPVHVNSVNHRHVWVQKTSCWGRFYAILSGKLSSPHYVKSQKRELPESFEFSKFKFPSHADPPEGVEADRSIVIVKIINQSSFLVKKRRFSWNRTLFSSTKWEFNYWHFAGFVSTDFLAGCSPSHAIIDDDVTRYLIIHLVAGERATDCN